LNLLAKSDDDVFILPMGWGSGYDAKTITDLLGEETFDQVVETYKNTSGLGKPGRRREAEWLGVEDSPKSRKIIEKPTGSEPMGWVACRFVADGETDWLGERREILKGLRPEVTISASVSVHPAPENKVAPLQTSTVAPPAPSAPHPEKLLVKNFTSTPKPGDHFEGVVFDVTGNDVFLQIPGLEDSEDYAVINLSGLPIKRPRVGEKVTCKVMISKKEKNYWRVECTLG
jgi:hypothetical protein